MATRNGTDIVESTVEVRPDGHGSFNVVSVVTTLEYKGCSEEFANFLAQQLDEDGVTYPRPTQADQDRARPRIPIARPRPSGRRHA